MQRLPTHADDPMIFWFWDLDEMIPFMGLLIYGMMTRQVIICVIAGIVVSKIYKKYRDSKPDGFLLHSLYWYGALPINTRTLQNPFTERYEG